MLIDFLSFCLSSSAGSIGTSLASHISHLHNAFFYHLPASLFPCSLFFRRAFVLSLFIYFFVGIFCCWRRTPFTPHAQHSTAQSAPHKTAKQVRKQTELARASTYTSSSSCSLCSQNERRNRNLPGLQKTQQLKQQLLAGVMREGFGFISNLNKMQHYSFSRSFFFESRTCMRRPGCCYSGAWSSWHFVRQVVSLSLKSWTFLSSSFAFCTSLPCERA